MTSVSALAFALVLVADVKMPMHCSHGDRNQFFTAVVSMPAARPTGSVFTVRIDSVPSERISHVGLFYIHDMTTDYQLPDGVTYIEGSARIVPGTGTPNVAIGATVTASGRTIRARLPGHVDNGSSYTPPSIEFSVRIDAPPRSELVLKFAHYEMAANVFLIGDLKTVCEPAPDGAVIGVTRVSH